MCNCGRRALKVHEALGYHKEGDEMVRKDRRVLVERIEQNHFSETAKTLGVTLTERLSKSSLKPGGR